VSVYKSEENRVKTRRTDDEVDWRSEYEGRAIVFALGSHLSLVYWGGLGGVS
jgi:hypothetical protein